MPSILVFYHYFHPDDVVSAQHLTDLCVELRNRGWEVTAVPSNRGCRNEDASYPAHEDHQGVSIRRIWRPKFRQASTLGRLFNAAWMITAWGFYGLRADVILVGTDPILSVTTALLWRRLRRTKAKIVHWCFDLYPDAAVADGILAPDAAATHVTRRLVQSAYRSCDLVVDIGACMRNKILAQCSDLTMQTLTPWALAEPDRPLPIDTEERKVLFGDAKLTLMYSGNFGRAHSFNLILKLAQRLRDCPSIRFAFSVRGNREQDLRTAVRAADTNISFAGFAPPERITQRLSAADIQMVSLEPDWTGVVVPSKFFGALAVGRPVLFAGEIGSSVAQWIVNENVGWVIAEDTLDQVADQMRKLAGDPGWKAEMFPRCQRVYQQNFSKGAVCDQWDDSLRNLLKHADAPEAATAPEDKLVERKPAAQALRTGSIRSSQSSAS